jgi:uncharacterized protein (DUF305 family)
MMKHHKLIVAALALTTTISLAACSNSTGGDSPSAPSESSSPAAAAHNKADITFAQMMIPHHSQAVDMSEMLLSKSDISEDVRQLATDISAAQGPEIEQLSAMLDEWGEDQEAHMGHSMDGMMSEEDMGALDAAKGEEAERLFLEQMIQHHTGAIEMAQTEVDDGENPDAVAMAENIISTQQAEIDQMEDLLASR